MRVLIKNYKDCRVFSDRPFGYKRYIVSWNDGKETIYSSLWYSKKRVLEIVEESLPNA